MDCDPQKDRRTPARPWGSVCFESCFVVLVLIRLTGSGIPVAVVGPFCSRILGCSPDYLGLLLWRSYLTLALDGPLFATALVLLVRRHRQSSGSLRLPLLYCSLVLAAVMSAVWSIAPERTLLQGAELLGCSVFGAYLASHPVRVQLRFVCQALAIAAAGSIALVLFTSGGIDTQNHPGAWTGIYSQKNILGRHMSLAALTSLLLLPSSGHSRWLPRVVFPLALALVYLSDSKASIVLVVLLGLPLLVYQGVRRRHSHAVSFAWTASVVALLALVGGIGANGLLEALGRDRSLSGRVELWESLIPIAKEQIWLGYGFGAFWMNLEGPYAEVLEALQLRQPGTTWLIGHAHNGFLDLQLQLGLIGILLFVSGLGVTATRALRELGRRANLLCVWSVVFLSFLILLNCVESELLETGIYWALYTATVFSIGRLATRPDSA